MLETFRDRGREVWVCRRGIVSTSTQRLFPVGSEIVVTSYSTEQISPLFLERETGLEPATSSLGKWAMFCFQ
jgi:hypothetical protein